MSKWEVYPPEPVSPVWIGKRLVHPSRSRDVVQVVGFVGAMVYFKRRGSLQQAPIEDVAQWRLAG